VIEFRLDGRSGIPPYLQLVNQVKQALRLGLLQPGDQLPTMREVVAQLAINPNTVLKAYRELEHEGVAAGRPGQGTFVLDSLTLPANANHPGLRADLERWLDRAFAEGLDEESVVALFTDALREAVSEGVA
jgi:GntR family transcriptional regulator